MQNNFTIDVLSFLAVLGPFIALSLVILFVGDGSKKSM